MIRSNQYIYIYIHTHIKTPRGNLEDDLDELVLQGKGEVTGGGSGITGSNIDIEIFEGDVYDFVQPIREYLQQQNMPKDTDIVVVKQEQQSLKLY